ncbi:MAG: hypothetical protein PVF57_06245 [Pseudomonadales bacterium]|jgi:hypothetical protein
MFSKKALLVVASALLLAACQGGDVNINANDNSVNTDNSTSGGGGANNPCAQYTDPDTQQVIQGSFDGSNCLYDSNFVGELNPLTVDLNIPFISGVHVFQDSLFVGEDNDGSDPNVPVPQSTNTAGQKGDGPILTIQAGARLAFTQSADYLLINRGSQIIAEGSVSAPIIISSFSDLVSGTADPESIAQWGGVVINGNGITSKCSDDQRTNDTCHILSEGKPSYYGGNNNAESSGTLKYVIVKHTGFEVADGDELNGITFNAVGSGTEVENVEAYSTSDDGLEFFGGAVNVHNYIALYVNDDSIDYSDGYVGTVTNALVIHGLNSGNRCIEGDNQGSDFDALPRTSPVVNNMTCIISAQDGSFRGDSEGPLLRRGVQTVLRNSIVSDVYARTLLSRSGNECFELNNDQTFTQASTGGDPADSFKANSVAISCEEATKGCRLYNPDESCADPDFANGDTVLQWVTDTGAGNYSFNLNSAAEPNFVEPTLGAANGDVFDPVLLNGIYTAPAFTDVAGAPLTITPEDVPDGATNANGDPIVGAVSADNDWTDGWAFGLKDTANGGRLWFNPDTGAAP